MQPRHHLEHRDGSYLQLTTRKARNLLEPNSDWPKSKLPYEILQVILRCAVAPDILLDPAMTGRSDSPWCMALRTKKAFALVCKDWWACAMQLLYRDITFRRVGQIAAFCQTLDVSNFAIEPTVHSIAVYCFVPKFCVNVFGEDLSRILQRCSKVCKFSYNPLFDDFKTGVMFKMPLPPHLSRLTHLDLSTAFFSQAILLSGLAFSDYSSLEHLALDVADEVDGFISACASVSVRLPSLSSLCLNHPNNTALDFVIARWSLPRLRRLTFLNAHFTFYSAATHSALFFSFLTAHGAELESLQLFWDGCPGFGWPFALHDNHGSTLPFTENAYNQNGGILTKLCPKLRHLSGLKNMTASVMHPGIEWLDLPLGPAGLFNVDALAQGLFEVARATLPSLKGVRLVDHALLRTARTRDLANVIPPYSSQKGTAMHDYIYRFPGVDVISLPDRLIQGSDGLDGGHVCVDTHGCRSTPRIVGEQRAMEMAGPPHMEEDCECDDAYCDDDHWVGCPCRRDKCYHPHDLCLHDARSCCCDVDPPTSASGVDESVSNGDGKRRDPAEIALPTDANIAAVVAGEEATSGSQHTEGSDNSDLGSCESSSDSDAREMDQELEYAVYSSDEMILSEGQESQDEGQIDHETLLARFYATLRE